MNKSYKKMNTNKSKLNILLASSVVVVVFSFGAAGAFASDITPENLSYIINQERTYYGLSPLKINDKLTKAASSKSEDMMKRHYFEHFAYGMSPWNFIENTNYNYLYAGENLAMDFQTSEGTVEAWMGSSLHRSNILNPDFNEMGIGVVKGTYSENGQAHETKIVTNMFGRQKPVILEAFDKMISRIRSIFTK